jgi:L-asparaginase
VKIHILVTGGTFDKEYNELTGELFFKDTHLPEMLSLGRSSLQVEMQTLMMVDSLQMTAADRERIMECCRTAPSDRVVVTHGTDTMAETAAILGRSIHNKTIILTGAMIPYKFGSSDGIFNLGAALAYVQCLPFGVYVAMNGHAFPWDNVRKNKAVGVFESIRR